jgi:hypothetical protein
VIESPSTRPPGPRFGISLVVMLVGGLAAAVGIVVFVSAFWSVLTGPVYQVPSTVRLHLDSGAYRVYELDRSGRGLTGRPLVDSSTLRVRAPDGSPVTVVETSLNENLTNGSESFDSVARFTTPDSGTYTLRFTPSAPTRVMVQPSLGDVARDHAGWLVLFGLGALLGGIGLVMIIVGAVRRGSARKRTAAAAAVTASPITTGYPTGYPPTTPPPTAPPSAAATPPPPAVAPAGWFPDPSGTHRLRYWDGQAWTEHIAD